MPVDETLVFVLPESHGQISGGNLYNAKLLSALGERVAVRVLQVGEWRDASQEPGTYLIDSLNLGEFESAVGARVEGQRFVLLVHHLPSLEPGLASDDASRSTESAALEAFDAFIATSAFTADYLRACGYQQPIVTIEPLVAAEGRARRDGGLPIRALMSCNLIARKGVLEFLEALASGVLDEDDFHIDIVGRHDLDPDYSAACAAQVQDSPRLASRVSLRGPSAYDSMSQWYEGANLFLSASKMETFGISLQEARQFALPIFAVRGGNSGNHVIEESTGKLFESPTSMAEGFLSLARTPTRLEHYSSEAQARRPRAQDDWKVAADTLLRFLADGSTC